MIGGIMDQEVSRWPRKQMVIRHTCGLFLEGRI